jgi:NAD(P)-dependent dehydrogenase (short-subunit alcohol dehydrogenase family)
MSRSILILGASSGIGRATALRLAAAGDRLVLASRGSRALERTAVECLDAGATSVTTRIVDVQDAATVDKVVRESATELGGLDVVLHSAGVVAYGRFEDIPAEVFDGVLSTNVGGAANVARASLPLLRTQRRGHLIFVGSILGNIAVPYMTPYVVSKYGIRSLGRQLALENRDLPDLHVSVVSPGSVDTPIYRQAANYLGRGGRPPAPVDSAEKLARAITQLVERPRDRVSVGLANPLMRMGFTFLPTVFDAVVGPLFRIAAMKPGHQPPTDGNVMHSVNELEAIDGGEGQGLADAAARLAGG